MSTIVFQSRVLILERQHMALQEHINERNVSWTLCKYLSVRLNTKNIDRWEGSSEWLERRVIN